MKNDVFTNSDGVIEVRYHGDQTEEIVSLLVQSLEKELSKTSGKVDYLIDLSDVGKTSLSARMAVVSQLKRLRINHQAVFGGSLFIKKLMNFMILASSKGGNIKYFGTRVEAVNWLKSRNKKG